MHSYYAALTFIKCSIIALYHRLASRPSHKMVLSIMASVVAAHGVAAVMTTAAMCTPVSIIWEPTFPVGCIDLLTFNYFNAAFHIITDLMIAIVPIPILRGLQISRKKKIGLIIAFGVGGLTIIGTIARQVTNAIALNSLDFSL